jgi:hypothetical protein
MPNDKMKSIPKSRADNTSAGTDFNEYYRALKGSVIKGNIRLIRLPPKSGNEPGGENLTSRMVSLLRSLSRRLFRRRESTK